MHSYTHIFTINIDQSQNSLSSSTECYTVEHTLDGTLGCVLPEGRQNHRFPFIPLFSEDYTIFAVCTPNMITINQSHPSKRHEKSSWEKGSFHGSMLDVQKVQVFKPNNEKTCHIIPNQVVFCYIHSCGSLLRLIRRIKSHISKNSQVKFILLIDEYRLYQVI